MAQSPLPSPEDPPADEAAAAADNEAAAALAIVFQLLRAHTGNDFACYKGPTVLRRIERRMRARQIDGLAAYVRFLQDHAQEIELLYQELLIGVTNFFRDPGLFDFLKDTAIPQLLQTRPHGSPLRVWTPACATGEETYSLAMVLKECLDAAPLPERGKIQVFATDLDEVAIDKARKGIFPAGIAAEVSAARLERFFVRYGEGYRIKNEIREMMVFAPQNILVDPPFTKLDILCCRNFLIYINAETQRKLLPVLHYALGPGGLLILGSAESTAPFAHLFTPLDKSWNVFQRKEAPPRPVIEKPLLLRSGPASAPLSDKSSAVRDEPAEAGVAAPLSAAKVSDTRVKYAPLADVPVLIIDENTAERHALEQILAHWSMKPDPAPDVPAGLVKMYQASAAGWPFPVVIAGAIMPRVDGLAIAGWVVRNPKLAGTVILMISAAERQTHAARCRELDVIYLERPISEPHLFSALLKALRFGGLPSAARPAAKKAAGSPLSSRPLRILLAEDRRDNQKLVVRILQKRGHTVAVAHDGRQAVELLQQQIFDLVLMDVQMPGMDGIQATAAIRALADPQKARVPIVAITAQVMKGDLDHCLAAGADAYITKPVDAQQLLELLEGVAEKAAGTRPAAAP